MVELLKESFDSTAAGVEDHVQSLTLEIVYNAEFFRSVLEPTDYTNLAKLGIALKKLAAGLADSMDEIFADELNSEPLLKLTDALKFILQRMGNSHAHTTLYSAAQLRARLCVR